MKKNFFDNSVLVISLLTAIAIAATEVPFWISFFSLIMILWKFLSEKNLVRSLPKILAPILGFFVFAIVYLQYKTLWGQEESTTVLLGLAAITIANFSSDRDHQFLVLLGFIIVMVKAVFSIDLIWIVPSMLAFLGLWLSLISNARISKLKFIFWHTLKSLPILLILFFAFPRIVIFQSAQTQKKKAKIGISEELNPGDIEEIIAQNSLAFRAEFSNQFILPMNEMYWRGAVLTKSNNLEWFKSDNDDQQDDQKKKFRGTNLEYKIVLEPSSSKLLFTLDSPSKIIDSNILVDGENYNTFRANITEEQQIQYTGISLLNSDLLLDPEDTKVGSEYLKHPKLPMKTDVWVELTKQKYKTAEDRLQALKYFFSNPAFVYTLSPGRYKDMDDFLFDRRKGFCEHYAAAFATMARALGIPSRVVIGYQGGNYNSAGGFWKISQKDAHAWTEIGMNKRWVRIDPTQWISPLRLTLGGEDFFALSEADQILFSHTTNWKKDDDLSRYWDETTIIFENLNYKWTLFLLNFDKQSQLSFLKDVSGEWPTILLFIVLIAVLVVTLRKRKNTKAIRGLPPLSKLMLFIELKSSQLGLEVKSSSTPLATLNQLDYLFKDETNLIKRFGQEYESVRYQNNEPSQSVSSWKKEWQNFFKKKVLK